MSNPQNGDPSLGEAQSTKASFASVQLSRDYPNGFTWLVTLTVLLLLVSVVMAFRKSHQALDAQAQASRQWMTVSELQTKENFYKIQKEQLELRLNELAFQEKTDEHVLEIYKLRIADYGKEMDAVSADLGRIGKETRSWEERRTRTQSQSRHFVFAAVLLAFVFLVSGFTWLTQSRLLLFLTFFLAALATAEFSDAFLLFWKW